MLDDITFGWWWTGTNSQSSTSKALTWIRCKLGKQYLVKKFTLPWESNPGPTPIRGDTATLIASVVSFIFRIQPARVASCGDPDSLEHSTGSELLHRSLLVEHEGRLRVVGLDAPHVVRVCRVEIVHQEVEGVPELAANLETDNDLTTTHTYDNAHRLLVRFLVCPSCSNTSCF